MNWRVRTLLKKELLDIVRDRRMLAMMLLVPVVLYPAMITLMGLAMTAGKAKMALEELKVAVVSDDAQAFLDQRVVPAHTTWVRMPRAQAEAELREKNVAAIVDAPVGSHGAVKQRAQAVVTVVYTKRHDRSVEGRDRVRAVLEDVSKAALVTRLEEAELPATFAEPVKRDEQDLDFRKDLGPYIASRLLPMLLLMMLFLGALYPAVDLTAGEKERGTLETLLVAPVHPLDVMQAKFVAVGLSAVMASFANLLAMSATFAFGIRLADDASVSMQLSASQVLVLVACLLPAAVMASGVSLAIASRARTFKEGQTLMTPVLLVAIMPGVMAMMPGVELNTVTSLIPLLNVALLVKATVLEAAQPLHVALTVVTTALCAVGALKLAANAFQSESLRFGDQRERGGLPSR